MKKPLTCIVLALAAAGALLASQVGVGPGERAASLRHPFRPPSGTWSPLANQPPNSTVSGPYFTASEMFLMTDGSVLCMAADTSYDFGTGLDYADPSVWKLTPDINGSYATGTWTQVASMHHSRLFFGSSVLADGRLILCGGEYADGSSLLQPPNDKVWTNESEIYDPVANTWSDIAPPAGWANIGDAPSMVLPNGTFLLGSGFGSNTAVFDPAANAWSAAPSIPSADIDSAETTWTLLPNNRVLAVSCLDHPDSLFYDASGNTWMDAGNTPTDLVDPGDNELGPALLLPNGNVFQMGATPFDGIYNPSANSWTNGPVLPSVNGIALCAPDAPAAMEPNGQILFALSPYSQGSYASVTYMVESDGTTMSMAPTPSVASENAPYKCRFLVLPTGQILLTAQGDSDANGNTVYIYTPSGTYQPSWQPTITSVSGTLQQGSMNNGLSGTQLNGISQGSSYGDDSTNFTNYPIVRIQNAASGHVFYCRTHDHSTMGVATGSTVVSTKFDVPSGVEIGPGHLYVVANGIPSAPQAVNVVAPHVVLPSGYSLFRGVYFAGGLSSLFYSDSNVLEALTGATLNNTEAPVQVVMTGSSPTLFPTSLAFTVTAKVNTPGTSQTISLWNYSTGKYDALDTRPIGTSNLTVTVNASGALGNYVSGSGAVQARVAYKQTGPTLIYRWAASIDLADWTIQ